jgi:hypothetical protein
MPRPERPLHRTGRVLAGVAAAMLGLAALYSCSLIVEQQSQQCQMDSDCSDFPGAHCDTAQGVCIGETSTGSTSSGTTTSSSSGATSCNVDGGIAGGGCYDDSLASCPVSSDPTTGNAELLNACASGCVPFDNSVKVPGLLPGDQLPSLPTNGPNDAGM